jgi:hypothetical protein
VIPLSLALLACGAEPETAAAAPADSEGGVVDWSAPAVASTYSVEDLDGVVAELLRAHVVHPLAIDDWFAGILADLVGGLSGCPGPNRASENKPDTVLQDWNGDCAGPEFTVHGGWIVEVSETERDNEVSRSAVALYSFTGQHTESGEPIAAGGKSYSETGVGAEQTRFELGLAGGFLDGAASTALANGVAMSVDWQGIFQPGSGLSGNFEGPIGGGDSALVLDGVELDPSIGPGATGTLRVRDPSSAWWDISLSDDHSGCGPVTWAGAEVGETCAGLALAESLTALFADQLVAP